MRVRLGAELGFRELVLDAEHRLAGLDERIEAVALVVLVALLVEREVEVRQELVIWPRSFFSTALMPRRCAWLARNTLYLS